MEIEIVQSKTNIFGYQSVNGVYSAAPESSRLGKSRASLGVQLEQGIMRKTYICEWLLDVAPR